MNVEELESLIQGNIETPQIDFKGPCEWKVDTFAKDILALSNIQDGGFLIIGVGQNGNDFVGVGVTEEIKNSYEIDKMKDQMSSYADPHVDFHVEIVIDNSRKEYVIIKVNQFAEIPIICSKDGTDVNKGAIYYRNRNRRVESAKISNSYDMRDLIELATLQKMKRMQSLGYKVEQIDKKSFNEELGDL